MPPDLLIKFQSLYIISGHTLSPVAFPETDKIVTPYMVEDENI